MPTMPVLLISATKENIFFPLVASVPILEYQEAPFSIMIGTLAHVSTLLMLVGFPQRPLWAGYGGLWAGTPIRPSILASRADSSPQTKAPAPLETIISKWKSLA